MRIARVFPRRTAATPTDELAFVDVPPPLLWLPEIDEVHISVAFTWDVPRAEYLARQWEAVGVPVKLGGPAYNQPGGDFVPGRYLKPGYVITSRGCPNHCWFCAVPKREGGVLRELPITEGWNVLDDNLLACSDEHIREVFEMLSHQHEQPIFTGGLEAKILKPWHAAELKRIRTKRMYCAYDTPDDLEPLREAGKLLRDVGFTITSHSMCCYVLIGYRGDTFEAAEKRLNETLAAGFIPYAMLYRDTEGRADREWRKFQRLWARPAIIAARAKEEAHEDTVACEESQAVTIELRKLGHEAYSCDILPCSGGHPEWHIQTDALELLKMQWDMILAFPPCTNLAVSGARHFKEKRQDGRQQRSIDFFMQFARANCPRIAIENPIGIMSTQWRKPDQIIQPWQFGHGETKATCLWLIGLPKLQPTEIVDGRDQRIWRMPPSADRARLRSKTFPGIARAMAEQWAGKCEQKEEHHAE